MKYINENSELNEYLEMLSEEEITDELISCFDKFRLEDKRYENEVSRHYAELTVEQAEYLGVTKEIHMSIDEVVIRNEDLRILKEVLKTLTAIQYRRIVLYYFKELSLRDISMIEKVSQKNIFKSIAQAEEKIKLYFRNLRIEG